MSTRPRIYISGPISRGNRTHNFAQACEAHKKLIDYGAAPLNPMLSMLHPDAYNIEHATWIECDLPWVEVADAVLRLSGESVGADAECEHAERHGVPVFRDMGHLWAWLESMRAVA